METDTLKKELFAAQSRLLELQKEYGRIVQTILPRKNYEQRVATLTLEELGRLPSETTVYRTLGRAFMKSSMQQVQERLSRTAEVAAADKETLLSRKGQLEEQLKAVEGKYRQLVQQMTKD